MNNDPWGFSVERCIYSFAQEIASFSGNPYLGVRKRYPSVSLMHYTGSGVPAAEVALGSTCPLQFCALPRKLIFT